MTSTERHCETRQRRGNLPGSGRQTGYLLLPVAVAIALIAVLAFLITRESTMEVNQTANELGAARAEYVAQAGLQHALRNLAEQGCGPYTDLTKVSFGSDEYDTKLTHDLGGTAAYTVDVEQDTWIRDDFPTNNYASDTKMHIRNEGGVIERPLLRYDLSAIPAKAAILSARAWFYVNKAHAEGPVDIRLVTADWTDTGATWDSMNASIGDTVLASIPTQPGTGVWVAVNLTAQVQAWINGEDNYGITIDTASAGVHAEYLSSESAFSPYIEVLVGAPPTSPAKLKSDSRIDGGGAASVKRDEVALRQNPSSYSRLILNSGSGQDAWIDSFYTSRNYGNDALDVDSEGTLEHALLRFGTLAVPRGARVISARLELYHTAMEGTPVDPGIDIHRVTRDWVEGTSSGSGTADGVTWNTWDGTNNWASGGGDYDVAPIAGSAISPAINDWESWDIRDLVQGWVDGTFPNHGLLLRGTGTIEATFASKEDADPALHPRLSISYACACGEVCVAPQGAGNILMVVVSPTALVDEDQRAKDLFESWGYTVNVIGESANQAAYDTELAVNDVVFISETVNSVQVGTKLVNAPIGVVSQDGDYNPDLGLATGSTFKVGADIDIVSSDHYITRPFTVGPLPIYARGMEQLIATGGLTADQQTLAEIGGDASLVILEQGAAMEGGGSTAGRRVILPLGTRYRFNWDYLNANGRLLVQRALEWGIEKPTGGDVYLDEFPDFTCDGTDEYRGSNGSIDWSGFAWIESGDDGRACGANLRVIDDPLIDDPTGNRLRLQSSDRTLERELDLSGFPSAYLGFDYRRDGMSGAFDVMVSADGGANWNTLDTITAGTDTAYRSVKYDISAYRVANALIRLSTSPGFSGEAYIDNVRVDQVAPTQQLLLVVPSPGSLGAPDAAKQALFESWGYTVNLIDDDALLADFVAATLVNDVAYVSATAVPGSVGSKLFKAPIGVVNANSGLHDDFGFSTVRYISSTNAPLNTVASHYITQPFNGGQVTLYTSDQISGGAVGSLAADLDQIGLWSSGALSPLGGLVTLDAGAMTSIGENTPGRRAQMPWDSLDVSALSADGLTILQRSLEWAEGANIDLSPFAHWKLDETTGPTAADSEGDNHGTWTNGPVAAAGLIDGGLDFDGSNDYVDAGTFDVVGSGITMMGWFFADTIGTDDPRIVSKAAGTAVDDAYWQLSTSNSGTERYLRMRIKAGGTTSELHDTSTDLAAGEWYFAVATYDASSGAMKLYLDGSEVASGTHAVGGALDTNAAVSVALGANGTAERFFDGTLDDLRIYNRALGIDEIADLYSASAPPEPGYYEVHQPWSATADDTWETVDLAPFGVPGDAVVEVAILNADSGKEQWGGARAVGSTLERRFLLHEPESGGVDALTLNVQADASGRIQHYSSKNGDLTFVLLGYWIGAAYTELFDSFAANDDAIWHNRNLATIGVGPGQIAEIVLQNSNGGAELQVGVRAVGSSINRRFDLHEAESGGVDAVSLMVQTDASSQVQVYAETVANIDFYVLGYWSTPPGSFTELGGTSARSTPTAAWGIKDVSALGVPPNSVTQFVITNDSTNTENTVGARAVGSNPDRFVQLQEAEAGGSDLVTMHANVDANTDVEWYSESGTSGVFFYPVGAWVLSP